MPPASTRCSCAAILIDRPEAPAWGAGEPVIGTLGGAVGSALFAATASAPFR